MAFLHSRLLRLVLVAGTALLTVLVGTGGTAWTNPPHAEPTPTYSNPVGGDAIPNFADPSVIRGRDGYWYAYATADPMFVGDYYRKIKIARSRDLTEWEYVGDVFTDETEPKYDGHGDDAVRMYWAPDIEYFGGRYLLYYSFVVNVGNDKSWRAIGVATAPTPAGPWTDSGAYVTGPETWEPRPGQTAWRNVIDPEVISTPDGKRYLYYGSVNGGVRVVELSADGLTAVGERTQITLENKYEAAHVVYRDGYYYLFLSVIGGCCAGPVSAYPVHVGRSTDPRGPFLDRDGNPVGGRHSGGTPVQVPNGNRWISVGHNTVATDLAGQQWLLTHGIDRYHPYMSGTRNQRQLVMSRLDWVDGWPTTNGGVGLLDGPAPAPAVDSAHLADAFESDTSPSSTWQTNPDWTIAHEEAGGFLQSPEAADRQVLYAAERVRGKLRARSAIRLTESSDSAGLVLFERNKGEYVAARIDRAAHTLVVVAYRADNVVARGEQPLPPTYDYGDWHELDVRVDGRQLTATLTHAGLDDPLALTEITLPPGLDNGRFGVVSTGGRANFDDVSIARLYTPVTKKTPDPKVGPQIPGAGDEFDGALGDGWETVREPAPAVTDGKLTLPVQAAELIDQRPADDDTAGILLRQPPDGEWTIETKVHVPFGASYPLGWPQAGLIAYGGDDEFVQLAYATAARTRHVTFGKEIVWERNVAYGDARLGPTTSDTVWLRLKHHVDDATGEHHYRAATSVDGRHWTWHGVRTLDAGSQPRIGLVAFGASPDEETRTATFEYLRFYRP